MRLKFLISIVLFSGITNHLSAQTRVIDSLKKHIAAETNRAEKLKSILLLCDQPINADTLLPYIRVAETLSVEGSKINPDYVSYAKASYYARKNYIDSALLLIEPVVARYKTDNARQDMFVKALFFKAKILDRSNQYTKSLTDLFEVVEIAGNLKDTLTVIQAKTGIGWVQMEMEQYTEALKWLYSALHSSGNPAFYKNYSALYSNIASSYNSLGKEDSAMHYINIAIRDARESENLLYLATSLSMQAKMLIDNKKPHLAEAPLHEALEIRKKLNDPFYVVYDMSSLASYYASNHQPDKGIKLCLEGIAIAKQMELPSQLLMIYKALAENYKAAGRNEEYSHTLEYIIALKDSFNSINSSKQLAEMQARNDAQKTEKTIIEQKLDLTKKNYWLFGSAIFAVMAAVIIWLGFKYYRRKQSIKMQLAVEEEKRIAAQSIIDAEEQERKRIAADLHDNIGAYATAIRADVEKITDNGLQKSAGALQNLQQHSEEIISSLRDTIWVLNKEHITITGISDRIKNYINKLQPTYSEIQFQVSELIENDLRISSRNALNIFRIVQEAVHNALKHSRASEISILIRSHHQLLVQIADNGQGMPELEGSPAGNGLINMKARAAEAGFVYSIDSQPSKGTRVSLSSTTN